MWALGGMIKGRVDRHLDEARRALPARLRTAFDRLLVERGLLADDPAPYFGVLGHPLFELPGWVAARLDRDGAPVREVDHDRALGVSALGYLHARAQDDWLDGDRRGDPTLVALAEVLLTRCTRLLVAVVGTSPRFWDRYDQLMASYAESLLHTDELRRTGAEIGRPAFEQLLEQSRPLALPSLALLDRAGRWELAPALEDFVVAEAGAAQLFNDLTDYHRDRERGQRTWVVEALDAAGRPLPGEVLDGGGAGAFATSVRAALAFHDRSVAAARSLDLAGAEVWLAERRTRLEQFQGALREALLAAFAGRLAGDRPDTDGQGTRQEAQR